MTDELNDPLPPEVLDPAPHRPIAGDIADDDGQALDDFFEAAPSGPTVWESYDLGKDALPKPTRILSRQIVLPQAGSAPADPVQVFPADVNRLHIRVESDHPIMIASDKTDCYGAAQTVSTSWYNDLHTGSVWVYSTYVTGPVTVNVWSITK